MKTKTVSILFALVMVLSMAVGVFAEDFSETWDENTVLTVFNDLDMYFPDMFADEDSDFLWVESGPADYPSEFESKSVAKAAIANPATVEATYDPCGDGLIKYDVTITKDDGWKGYYGDSNTTYVRNINAELTVAGAKYSLGVKTCESTGGDNCKSVTFKKTKTNTYEAHLKGYLTVPYGIIMYNDKDEFHNAEYSLTMDIDFSTYMTALWPVEKVDWDYGTVTAKDEQLEATKKDYCQPSLQLYDAFGYASPDAEFPSFVRAKYDENTGEARLQVVVRNYQPDSEDYKKQNYVIPADVFADFNGVTQRITDYTCKYTIFNVANAAPRTDYCKFGEGIAIPNHGMVRIDISIDHLSGAILREAAGEKIPFSLRLGGYMGNMDGEPDYDETFVIYGEFEAVEIPCPPVSRLQVKDPIKPFMTFFNVLKNDGAISPSGAYGVYEGGVWGMYQKCGKLAYMAVRLNNDGIQDEVIDLNKTAVALNGGTPMKWNWVMSTVEPEKNNKIILPAGEEVILIGRAKVTDIPSQLNADVAMTGAVNFTDLGFYITGKVFSDHNNTRCVAAPK